MPSSTSNLPKIPVGSFLKIDPGSNHFSLALWPPYCYLWHGLLNSPFLCPYSILPFILNTEVKVTQTSSQTMSFLCSKPSQIFHLTQTEIQIHKCFITVSFTHLTPVTTASLLFFKYARKPPTSEPLHLLLLLFPQICT